MEEVLSRNENLRFKAFQPGGIVVLDGKRGCILEPTSNISSGSLVDHLALIFLQTRNKKGIAKIRSLRENQLLDLHVQLS